MDSEKIKAAPKSPGCYMFKDKLGNIIYVGKSRDLSKRVRQYFRRSYEPDDKLRHLVRAAVDVEYIETATELDALILEYTLIKGNKPWFNSQLKRDRQRPYLKLTLNEAYPALYPVYETECDGARYYGIFRDGDDLAEALALFQSVWRTPTCMRKSFDGIERPCLNMHLGKCQAPCGDSARGGTGQAAYGAAVREISRFLDGTNTETVRRLKREMQTCAEMYAFEQAAECKRKLDGLQVLRRRCRSACVISPDADYAVLLRPYRSTDTALFIVKGGEVRVRIDNPGSSDVTAALDASGGELDGQYSAACLAEIYVERLVVKLPKKRDAAVSAINRALIQFSG